MGWYDNSCVGVDDSGVNTSVGADDSGLWVVVGVDGICVGVTGVTQV